MSPDNKSGDREFEQYLHGKSPLSQHYAELPEVKLPDHLDAAILAEAHRAVGAGPGNKRKRSWTMPLSLVATLFVVVMAGLMLPDMLRDTSLVRQYQAGQANAPDAASPAELPLPAPVAAPESAVAMLAKKQATRVSGVQIYGQLQADSVAVPMRAEEKLAAKPSAVLQDRSADNQVAKSAALAPAAPAASLAAAPEAAPVVAASVGAQQLQRETAKREMMRPAEKKPAVKPQQLAAEQAASPLAAVEAEPEMALADQSRMDTLQEEIRAESLQPEEWLKRIRKLKQLGKVDEARKELTAFKRRYPAYSIPADLLMRE